ncbi:MAG: hypothetical protein U0263_37495 [Polyangiaceae bacterium]
MRGLFSIVLACELTAGCAASSGFQPAEQSIIDRATSAELYALQPEASENVGANASTAGQFHGHRVLGRAELRGEERDALVDAARKAMASSDGRAAKCFLPRHGLRFEAQGKAVELAICFECLQMKVFEGTSERTVLIGKDGEAALDAALARHGLSKAP